MYETVKDFIATLGFPIFVSCFLLFRLEKGIERLWKANKQTNIALAVLLKCLMDGTSVPAEVMDKATGIITPPSPEEGD